MALMSVVLLGRRLNLAQWCSLLVISGALLLSTVAEGKGGKKGYAPGRADMGLNMLELQMNPTCWVLAKYIRDFFYGRSDLDLWD